MVKGSYTTIRYEAGSFTYHDACQLAKRIRGQVGVQIICVDLHAASDTSTAAFARLVVLRRDLLSEGRDLRVAGLLGRANGLYEVNRLASLLPRMW